MIFALPFLIPPLNPNPFSRQRTISSTSNVLFLLSSSSPSSLPSFLQPFSTTMEDPNTLAADCIVICCCCQCLALQIVLLLLLKLPWKLVRKTREFAKRRLRQREKERNIVEGEMSGCRDEVRGISNGRCMRNEGDGLGLSCCMEEVEKVMEDLHEKGEFGFGSFWGKGNSISEQFNATNVQYQLIQVIPST